MTNDKKENIVLIGMSGAGKSTLGARAAQQLNLHFDDTDKEIMAREGRTLQEIIDCDGVDAFLDVEERIVSSLCYHGSVVATGGSVVYSEKIMANLQKNSLIVYLYLPFEELHKRLGDISARGIVIKKGNSLLDVYNERLPLYRRYADVTVDCTARSIDECTQALVSAAKALH